MENPFDINEEHEAYVLFFHTDLALTCLARSRGMNNDYASIVLVNKAQEHLKDGLQLACRKNKVEE